MDARAVWDIAVFAFSVLGTGLAYWRLSYKIGKTRGADVEKVKALTLAVARIDREHEEAANRDLRIFAAIEEIRRRLGNGNKEWFDLTGGK